MPGGEAKRLACLLLALWVARADAHPVDEVVQGAYLTLAAGQVRLELDLAPGAEVAEAFLTSLDTNRDQRITEVEARGFAARVLEQSTLLLDGVAVHWALDQVTVPAYQALRFGNDILRIQAIASRADSAGMHALSYRNRFQPAKSQRTANVFVQPGGGWTYQVTGQERTDDGQQLKVSYVVARQ